MEFKAIHRYADMSARKIRPFAALIRGRSCDEALELLKFEPNRGARLLEKVLKSAMGNAEDRGMRGVESFTVTESRVDDAPMFKRIMPRGRGTAFQILRRMAHIHVKIGEELEVTTTAPTVSVTTPTVAAPNVLPAPVPVQAN